MNSNKKINVLFITPGLGIGGAERWIISLVKNFQQLNTKAIVVTLGHGHVSMFEEAKKHTNLIIGNWGKKDLVTKNLDEVDVIVSWGCDDLLKLTECFSGPIVEVSHNDPSHESQVKMLKSSCLGATHFVGVSENACTSFQKEYRDKSTVIYNGIEQSRLKPKIGRKKQREIWEIDDNQKVVLFISRLCKAKNPFRTMDAISYLPDDYIGIFIRNGENIDEYLNRASDRIRFIEPNLEIGDFLDGSDVFAMSSNCEGMPLVLLEAWMSGIPTVTTEYNTYKELQKLHGNLSWSVPMDSSPEELAIQFQTACESGRNSERVVEAKRIAEDQYTVEAMVNRWEDYLIKVVEEYDSPEWLDDPC